MFSIINTYLLKPNLSTTQTLGFIREKIWATNEQPFGPRSIPGGAAGTASINMFGSNYFPGVSIVQRARATTSHPRAFAPGILNIGPNAEGQASNTGVFQNRIAALGQRDLVLGKHTVSFGGSYSYTQLNTIDKRTGTGTVATDDFSQFAAGLCYARQFRHRLLRESFLQGNANRYYRATSLACIAGQVPGNADAQPDRGRAL